jgi:hypothetical protein
VLQVNQFPGARHASYPTLAEARRAWADAVAQTGTGPVNPEASQACRHSSSAPLPSVEEQDPRNVLAQGTTANPPPYTSQTNNTTPRGLRIKTEELTPCVPASPLLGGRTRQLTISPLAQQFPCTHTLTPLTRSHPRSLTLTTPSSCNRVENWWVVAVGNHPGMYHGK